MLRIVMCLVAFMTLLPPQAKASYWEEKCRTLAGSPWEPKESRGPISFSKYIKTKIAIPACKNAVAEKRSAVNLYRLHRAFFAAKDYEAAFPLAKESASLDYPPSINALGLSRLYGFGTHKSPAESIKYFKKAAEQNDALGQFHLCYVYRLGKGVKKDLYRAAGWCVKSAEQGVSYAQYRVGKMYYRGDGLEENQQVAARWFEKAADQGHHEAQLTLAQLYEVGMGVPKDLEKAAFWYKALPTRRYRNAFRRFQERRAAYVSPKRQSSFEYEMGKRYYRGLNVVANRKLAARWFEKAARLGHHEAQLRTARSYEVGIGVPKNQKKAAYWYGKLPKEKYQNALRMFNERRLAKQK